jgi:HSP20 family protein
MTTQGTHPLVQLRHQFDDLFDRIAGNWLAPFDEGEMGPMRVWNFDASENDNEIDVKAEMPGFEPSDLDVQLHGNVLSIKAEKQQKTDREERYGRYERRFTLPQGIDPDKVEASYRNGVLELRIPKTEQAKGKHIEVQGERGSARQLSQQSAQGQPSEQRAASGSKGKKS